MLVKLESVVCPVCSVPTQLPEPATLSDGDVYEFRLTHTWTATTDENVWRTFEKAETVYEEGRGFVGRLSPVCHCGIARVDCEYHR